MNTADTSETASGTAVVLFGGNRLPRSLAGLAVFPLDRPANPKDVDAGIGPFARLIVVGGDADLAIVLTRLLRLGRLDIEVGYAPRRPTAATRAYRLPAGWRAVRRARHGIAQPAPLIRDDTGTVLVGAASWLPVGDAQRLHGEGIVDDAALFDGEVTGVRIEPTPAMPGLRAGVISARGRVRRWVAGRAAQLGTTGALVVRDGVPGGRTVKRSTFYRHTEAWLCVR